MLLKYVISGTDIDKCHIDSINFSTMIEKPLLIFPIFPTFCAFHLNFNPATYSTNFPNDWILLLREVCQHIAMYEKKLSAWIDLDFSTKTQRSFSLRK